MTDMVERVARALCSAEGENPDYVRNYPGGTVPQWIGYKIPARAAIRALMEPTTGMYDAAWKEIAKSDDLYQARQRLSVHELRAIIRIIAQAMLKAALDE